MIDRSLIKYGKGILKLLLFFISLCSMPVIGVAQDDVLTGDRDEEPKFKAENFGQNYIDLRQPRFLYSDYVEYKNRKFYDHLSVGLVWHYDKIYERIEQGYDAFISGEIGHEQYHQALELSQASKV